MQLHIGLNCLHYWDDAGMLWTSSNIMGLVEGLQDKPGILRDCEGLTSAPSTQVQ